MSLWRCDAGQAPSAPKASNSELIKALEAERVKFEKWITAPPFEKPTHRNPQDAEVTAWPGAYKDYEVELAWEAWVAAKGF